MRERCALCQFGQSTLGAGCARTYTQWEWEKLPGSAPACKLHVIDIEAGESQPEAGKSQPEVGESLIVQEAYTERGGTYVRTR